MPLLIFPERPLYSDLLHLQDFLYLGTSSFLIINQATREKLHWKWPNLIYISELKYASGRDNAAIRGNIFFLASEQKAHIFKVHFVALLFSNQLGNSCSEHITLHQMHMIMLQELSPS
jgi:hypothetical protein